MGKWIEDKNKKDKAEERRRHRNDKYADFCFTLANTSFGSILIACAFFLLQEESAGKEHTIYMMMFLGVIVFVGMCCIGSKFLK